MRLPVGGYRSPLCIRKITDTVEETLPGNILIGDDLESGTPLGHVYPDHVSYLVNTQNPSHREIRLKADNITKHMFVTGSTGFGKTSAIFNMLIRLYTHNIPFLVLEPVKTEYRVLKTLRDHPDPVVRDFANNLRIYSAGHEGIYFSFTF